MLFLCVGCQQQTDSLAQNLIDSGENLIVKVDTLKHNEQKKDAANIIEQIKIMKEASIVNISNEAPQEYVEYEEEYIPEEYTEYVEYEEYIPEEYVEYDDSSGWEVSYDPAYNTDGPTREMPGYYDGYIETYYSSNVLHHYKTDEWTVDEEGFYRDDEGRYIIGVDESEGLPIGTVVETGKGEAVVMDYGSGMKVHDFYTNW